MGYENGYWQCGHCGFAPLLLSLDIYCLNPSCMRHRDAYASVYDIDESQNAESSGSLGKKVSGWRRQDHSAAMEVGPLPPFLQSLSRAVISIPNHCLTFSAREDLSFSNKCKAFLEQLSGESWCWWPLKPRMRLLQHDEIRMHWRCVSWSQCQYQN